ncbi:MAG: ZIP family metal transporter [Bacteroidota bacterium]
MSVLFQVVVLFFSALLGGLSVLLIRQPSPDAFKRLLLFAGGYLFAITVLHILPELFALYHNAQWVGLYILIGFFLQLLLELLSQGIEHGHLHEAEHTHHRIVPATLLFSLCIHAFLDGVVLNSPTAVCAHHHHTHGTHSLLLGIVLHKLPVAFALVSVLRQAVRNTNVVVGYLVLFAAASPIGLWSSHYCIQHQLLSMHGVMAVMAIASGSFLHIATTIFFESTPDHRPHLYQFLASLMGAVVAVVLEWCL